MADLRNHHTTRSGRNPLERPGSGRPAGHPSRQGPQVRPINEVLGDLAKTRGSYEQLRASDAPLTERAKLISALHDLRAEAAQARRATGRA
jgi:hypothetical protein